MRNITYFVFFIFLLVTPVQAESEKKIAFTFDDAPLGDGSFFSGKTRTSTLISALEAAGVDQAAFFVTIRNVEKFYGKERLGAYVKAGHVLANHSHTHMWLRRTKPKQYLSDIDRAERALSRFDGRRPWFRYPYLDEGDSKKKRDVVRSGLADRGLSNGYVTVDNYDWYLNRLAEKARSDGVCLDQTALRDLYIETILGAAEFYDEIAKAYLERSPAHVLLLHENDLAALFVEELANAFRVKGWKIIPIDEAYEDAIADVAPETLFNGQGRVAAIAHTRGAAKSRLVNEREDEETLSALFLDRIIIACDGEVG